MNEQKRYTITELDVMSSYNIDRYRTELEQELKQAIVDRGIVERQKIELQRKILNLQIDRKDIDTTLSKSIENMRKLRIEIDLAKSKFWAVKNEGR